MLKFVKHFLFPSNCLDLYHIKREMARNKQYNEQEVIEKRCLYSGAMGIKIPRYVC
jgi:hypothetical protein